MDYRSSERWDARKTAANTADLRGKVLRIRPLANIQSNVEPGLGKSYTVPTGNMFPQGMANTRPEIYAMGFRQPFTVHTDPANPGAVVVGEFCHDNSVDQADRSPAGVCEWNLVDKPGFHGWPFCVGDNSSINTTWRWNYANNTSTGQQYNCSLQDLPCDLDWAPPGQTGAPPTFQGRATIPGPATPATVWKKYPNNPGSPNPLDFGDFGTGGMQPVTGPVYRYKAGSGPGAFPEYFDGSWLITNRGTDNGFWKEVRLRQDTNHMLRVNDWLPYNNFGTPNNSFVIPTQFGPDGALYMARWSFGCCRNQLSAEGKTELIKIEFAAHRRVHRRRPGADGLAPDRGHARTGRAEHLPQLGHAQPDLGRRRLLGRGHDRVPGQRRRLDQLHGARPVRERWDLHGRVPGDRQRRERLGACRARTFTVRDEPTGPPATCTTFAKGTAWDPNRCEIAFGGTVTWRFDQPDAQFPHDVWVVPPGGNPDPAGPDITQVTSGPVSPGGAPVSRTFNTAGTWQFICRIHSGFAGGQWSGMVGTVPVAAQ